MQKAIIAIIVLTVIGCSGVTTRCVQLDCHTKVEVWKW